MNRPSAITTSSTGEVGARVETKFDAAKEAAYEELRFVYAALDVAHAGLRRVALRELLVKTWRDRVEQSGVRRTVAAAADRLAETAVLERETLIATGSLQGWADRAVVDKASIAAAIVFLEGTGLVRVIQRGEGRRPWIAVLVVDGMALAAVYAALQVRTEQLLVEIEPETPG